MRGFIFTFFILFFILSLRFFLFYQNQPVYKDGQEISLRTILLSEPKQLGTYQRITARLSKGDRIFITAPAYPKFQYGQTLQIDGRLRIKEVDHGHIYTMSYPKLSLQKSSNVFVSAVAPIRSRILWLFHTTLSQPEASLLIGIVFGISETMPKEFSSVLQQSGVLHVIAASGMNVTIIGSFLAGLFGRIFRRQYALVMTIGGIVFYAGLAGFSASIVRASIMGVLVFSAQILGRQTLALYGLMLAGFLMLFFQPFLLFDTGFALSFMATWGLIVFNPLVQRVTKREGRVYDLIAKTDFSTTFIAQIATLPILLGTFGSYSPVSIIVNFLVLWTIPVLMIIGGMGTLVGLILPVLGQWILYLSLPFLYFFEGIVWFFGSLPVNFTIENLPWPIVAGYYLLLLAFLLSSRAKPSTVRYLAKRGDLGSEIVPLRASSTSSQIDTPLNDNNFYHQSIYISIKNRLR